MKDLHQQGWSKRRFVWLERVQASQGVPRGSKQLAALICNKFVDRKTGSCWPSNRKLADSLYVCRRTIQRYIAGLANTGFLKQGHNDNGRRVLLLSFPETKGPMKKSCRGTSQLSSPRDNSVTPHTRITKTKNQKDLSRLARPISWISVPSDETEKIDGWREWLQARGFDPDLVMGIAQQRQGVRLPANYPEST